MSRRAGIGSFMQETRDPQDDREDLWSEAMWSLGLMGAVVALVILISMIGHA
jgi:hypothetical protein